MTVEEAVYKAVEDAYLTNDGIGPTFAGLCETAWTKMVASAIRDLVDEEKIVHRNNRYYIRD